MSLFFNIVDILFNDGQNYKKNKIIRTEILDENSFKFNRMAISSIKPIEEIVEFDENYIKEVNKYFNEKT